MRIIDIDKWERKEHFLLFQGRVRPQFSITFNLNIAELFKHRDKQSDSRPRLTDMLYYVVMRSVNLIPEFKMRIVDMRPVEFDMLNAAFTYVPKNRSVHANCIAEYDDDFYVFTKNIDFARMHADQEPTLFPQGGDSQALVYISCINTINFSSVTNPWGDPWIDTVPRIIFGKANDRSEISLCIEVLHSFIDGIHISQFVEMFYESIKHVKST